MTTPSPLLRALLLAGLSALPALGQTVTGRVTAATNLIVSAGFPPANTNTRGAGFDITGGLNLSATWAQTPLFVTVNSVFGYSATANSITHTINESMSGFNAPVSAGPHATLLTLTASQPVTGTLTVQYTPGATGGGASSTASIDIGDDGSVEWTRAPGTSAQTFQQQVTVNGTLPIRVATAMVSTAHSLSVQFTNWLPHLPLVDNGFENGLTNWRTFGNVLAPAAAPPATEPRNGSGLCKMFGNFTGSLNVSGAFQKFAASPGESYALDGYARHWSGDALIGAAPSGNHAIKKIVFLDVGGNEIGAAESLALDGSMATDAWLHTATVVATAPAGTVAVQPMLLFVQPANAGGAAQFDDVSFARVDSCGTFALPIGGAAGSDAKIGAAFTLDVAAPQGVRICGIDLVSWAIAGRTVDATVYLHRSLTDASQLTAAQTGADNWCPIAALHGVSNGPGVRTPFTVTNATNSLQLLAGQHLLAIKVDISPSAAPFQFTLASTFTAADAGNNLVVRPGASVDLTPFYPLVPGYIPGTLHFEVLSTAATPSTCAAENVAVGTPCGGEPNAVYELFRGRTLSDVLVTGNGTGASLSSSPHTALVAPASTPIALPGGVSAAIPLGFDLGAFGLLNVTDIRVCDQGSIFFGGVGNTTGNPSPILLSNDPVARLAACWKTFTSAYSSIYVDVVTGVQAVVTFDMYDYDPDIYSLFQVVITPTAMRVRYDPALPYFYDGLRGFHNGIALPAPPTIGHVDLSAGPSPFTSPNAAPDVTLTVLSRPLLNANFDFRLDNCPSPCLAFVDFAHAGPGVALPTPLFAPACTLYISPNAPWSFAMAPGSVTSIFTPNNTSLLGFEFALQGGGLLPNGRLAASNAFSGTVGNW